MFVQRKMKIVWITSLRQKSVEARKENFFCVCFPLERKRKFPERFPRFSFFRINWYILRRKTRREEEKKSLQTLNWGNLMKIQGLQFSLPPHVALRCLILDDIAKLEIIHIHLIFVLLSGFFRFFAALPTSSTAVHFTSRAAISNWLNDSRLFPVVVFGRL